MTNGPSSDSQRPRPSDEGAVSHIHSDLSKIGADEIPDELWDFLKELFPRLTRLIDRLRYRLVDCRSDSINAGTALTLMAAVSNVAVLKHELYLRLQADLQTHHGLLLKLTEEFRAYRENAARQPLPLAAETDSNANDTAAGMRQNLEMARILADLEPKLGRMNQILVNYQEQEAINIFNRCGGKPNPSGLDYASIAAQTASILTAIEKPWWARSYLFLPVGVWIIGVALLLNLFLPVFNFIRSIP
jgi:hypothetical protein